MLQSALLALPPMYLVISGPGMPYELRYMVIHLFLPVGQSLSYDDGILAFIFFFDVTSCLAFEGGVSIIPNTTTVSHSHSHTLS
jgi:hypothetical protein